MRDDVDDALYENPGYPPGTRLSDIDGYPADHPGWDRLETDIEAADAVEREADEQRLTELADPRTEALNERTAAELRAKFTSDSVNENPFD